MNGLGIKQRQMLLDLRHHGDGGWPPGWKLRFDHKSTLATLFARQLVSSPDDTTRLTSAGYLVAASLSGELP